MEGYPYYIIWNYKNPLYSSQLGEEEVDIVVFYNSTNSQSVIRYTGIPMDAAS
jgi:hypothetical protein